jgi:hypothetical protein
MDHADKETKIENALSAAPAAIAEGAAVVDWELNQLREGTNGWTCMPDPPQLPGNAPMCLDEQWVKWPTPGDDWVHTGPHVMIIVPDPAALDGLPTDPNSGGPYVMWKGTPYVHIMMPVAAGEHLHEDHR